MDYAAILDTANRRQFADVLPPRVQILEFGPTSKAGPHECCSAYAAVIACDGETDTWECPVCSAVFEAPCR